MSRYTSATDADRQAMLEAIGAGSVEELFEQIPAEVRLDRALDLPNGLSEPEVYAHLSELAARNADARVRALLPRRRDVRPLRAGDRRRDPLALGVPHARTRRTSPRSRRAGSRRCSSSRPACRSSPRCRFRTRPCTRGPRRSRRPRTWRSARGKGRTRLVVSRGLHPHSRETLATYARGFGAKVVEVGLRDGLTDRAEFENYIDTDVPRSSSRTRTSSAGSRTSSRSPPPRTNRALSRSPRSTR